MNYYSDSINKLIGEMAMLPGIGPKSAGRLAFHILEMPKDRVKGLTDAILDAREKTRLCKECFNLSDDELCPVCSDPKRNHKLIMVVEEPSDLVAYEKTGQYEGVYHVLHGAVNPAIGVQPENLKLKELLKRLATEDVEEVIVATNSTVEGEATALWISKFVKQAGIKVTRIASGVPVGGALEYVDEMTLYRALEGRTEL
ncbi:MAG TPA: recombination protein RecR [Lachnospiraceae bacterium]|nr:recombination protein RecR [Lachnospiraceae bacterium]